MSILSSILRPVSQAAGRALQQATGGIIPARVITIPKSAGERRPASSSPAGVTPSTVPEAPRLETGETQVFTASWSFFLLLVIGGMLIGMIFRKKF